MDTFDLMKARDAARVVVADAWEACLRSAPGADRVAAKAAFNAAMIAMIMATDAHDAAVWAAEVALREEM